MVHDEEDDDPIMSKDQCDPSNDLDQITEINQARDKNINESIDDEYDEEDEEENESSNGSPERIEDDPEKQDFNKSAYKKINGVVPKDIESKKEMMSFIAYPPHIENTCKLLS